MACYHPITAYDLASDFDDPLHKADLCFGTPVLLSEKERQRRSLQLPCRKCVGCRLSKSREWANRVLMEQKYHDDSWFLTLTYDDEHLPIGHAVSALGDIINSHATLVKKDFQDFMKRLRFNSGQKIRYYVAGEYGSHTYRPHYHALLFGLYLDDLEVIRKNFNGDQYYISSFIEKCWPFGIHVLGKVTWQSAAYVARYTMKKARSDCRNYNFVRAGIQPEFQCMSLKPAIGRQYFDDHPEIFDYDYFSISTPQGGRKIYPPEYFRKLYRESHPLESHARSSRLKEVMENNKHLKLMLTDKSYSDILLDEEEACFRRISSLTRDDI